MRIEREELEVRGFVTNVERLLAVVDDSENGKFASRLAGLLSGSQRIPSTVLQFASGADHGDQLAQISAAGKAGSIVADTASAAEIESVHTKAAATTPVEITTRQQSELTGQAIAEQAKKGYGLLLIGLETAVAADGEIDAKIAGIAAAVDVPLAIAVARGPHRPDPAGASHLDILAPITGTGHSRRGAEIAVALARASLGRVTMLHVVGRDRLSWRTGTNEAAILRDAVQLGDQFGVPIRTAVSAHADADDAILSQLKGGEHDLIVMGVSPRPGATLSFGGAAATILERSDRSVLLIAS
jgi:Universal stress protein family